MQISVEITNVIVDPEFNAAEIIITPIFSSGDAPVVDVPIETISANGVNIPIVNKNIDIIIPTKTSDLTKDDVYTKTEINNKLSAVYEFKGSVLAYAELPNNAENADVWNVEENGVNYAWSDELNDWDSLGGLIGLATSTENGLLSKEDFEKLVNLSGTNTGDETQDSLGEKIELTELTEITDTTKIAASDSAFLKWFSGLKIKNYLTGFFAKLSGGNTFADAQNFDGMINHKAGEYFYTAASKTADTVNDTRVINTVGVEIHSICTALGATKGGGTWVETYKIFTNGVFMPKEFSIANGLAISGNRIDYGNGFSNVVFGGANGTAILFNMQPTGNAIGARFSSNNPTMKILQIKGTASQNGNLFEALDVNDSVLYSILKNGSTNLLAGLFYYNAASPTADTINDTRTVNTSGLWELFKCSLGNATKGLGTWIYGRMKLGMVIETEINEYTDNAAALAAGLTAGMKYRTGDLYKIVH